MITDAVKDAADENVPETWTEEMAAAVTEAVADELAARLLVEEPVVETFVEVEEPVSEDDDDEEEEEEDDSFFGFGSMPLDFIDAVAEADRYAEMLEQERRGEVRLVTRYRRSFTSRLIQSQGNVQDYYSIIKNALLSHKGVKNRISWNYEAFNRGRTHVAKINAKTKTLYLYLALDPEELKDTKYGIVDVSSKKKYASVPVLMKIKGERKFKYALELIAKLCGEDLGLPKLDAAEVDYRMPYQPTEELVASGVVKKLVAAVPVSAYGAESTEDAPVGSASATAEAQEVTFVAPTDAPAVEAAAGELPVEEVPVEETPVEEAPAEETPADAPASNDEPTEV
jgi:predicted transport protein